MLATSDPAPGSVIAMQVLFFPSSRSGKKRSCNCLLPNLSNGGTPNAIPVVREPDGPARPDRAIYSASDTIIYSYRTETNLIRVDSSVQIVPVFHFQSP